MDESTHIGMRIKMAEAIDEALTLADQLGMLDIGIALDRARVHAADLDCFPRRAHHTLAPSIRRRRLMFKMLIAAATLTLIATPLAAAPCKDARGRFTKCPKPAAGAIKCRDAKGHFAKCGMPGTRPA